MSARSRGKQRMRDKSLMEEQRSLVTRAFSDRPLPTSMHTGVAVGGPRNRVKLSAPLSWNGRIKIPSKDGLESTLTDYPGYYNWQTLPGSDFEDVISVTWVWIPSEPHTTQDGKNKGHPQTRNGRSAARFQ